MGGIRRLPVDLEVGRDAQSSPADRVEGHARGRAPRETNALLGVHGDERDAERLGGRQVGPQQRRVDGVEGDGVAGRGEGSGRAQRLGEGVQLGEPPHLRGLESACASTHGVPRGIRADPGVAGAAHEGTGDELQVVLPAGEQAGRHGDDRAGLPSGGVVRLALTQFDAEGERVERPRRGAGEEVAPRGHGSILTRASDIGRSAAHAGPCPARR